MNIREIKIKSCNESFKYPVRATEFAAGIDFFSLYNITILSKASSIIPLGCKLEMPPGFYMQLKERSSLAIKGLIVMAGTLDGDFRGQPLVIMHNLGKFPVKIKRNDKFVQGIILKNYSFPLTPVKELGPSIRGERGLGSSGQ
jgi:dUTP pyrophosphatase